MAIEIAGGQLIAQREQAFPQGTQISVEDLFFNVPARRKFLKVTPYLTKLRNPNSVAFHTDAQTPWHGKGPCIPQFD